jgi:hypothetical protein
MRTGGWLAWGCGLVWLATLPGCSLISDSSRSLSKSVSSPSTSSSDRSDPRYMREIRTYSYGYARSGGDPQAFARGVASLAERGGVHDWEESEETCRAVGEGFRDAGAGKTAAEASIAKIVAPDSECGFWMRAGYHER